MSASNEFSKQRLGELLDSVYAGAPSSEAGHICDEDLVDYVLGVLNAEAIERIEHHRGACPECAQALAELYEAKREWNGAAMQGQVNAAREQALAQFTERGSAGRRIALMEGIAKVLTQAGEWFEYTGCGIQHCEAALAPVLGKRSPIPESLPIGITAVEVSAQGSLVIRLCWLDQGPDHPPRVEAEDGLGGIASEVRWVFWQTEPKGFQKLEIKGLGLTRQDLDTADAAGDAQIALQWNPGPAAVLRIRLAPK